MAGAAVELCPNHTNTPKSSSIILLLLRAACSVNHSARIFENSFESRDLGAQETVNDHPNNGSEASPQRVRAGRGPARRQAHAPPAVLLHGDPGGHDAEALAEPAQGSRASPPPCGARGAAGGADAEPAVHREAAGDAAGAGAGGVEAGVPDAAAAAYLHGQQDRGRGREPAGGDPRGRGHRRAGRAPAAAGRGGAARRAGPGVRRLPAGRARALVRRRVPAERRQGARGQAPAPHRRRQPRHARRPRHRRRPPVHRQLVLGPLPQVPHRRPRGDWWRRRRLLRRLRRADPGGLDGGVHGQGPPRRALPQALPAPPRRRRLAAREDRQGRRVPPEAPPQQRRQRAGVRPDAHGEARRAARDSGRRHDRPPVGGDDEPRPDLPPRRQGVRARHGARHHLRRLHLQRPQGRHRRRRVAAAAAQQRPGDDGAADAAGRVRAPPQPPGGRRPLHAPWPRRQRRSAAAGRSTCGGAGAGGHDALVPERRGGDGPRPRRRRGPHSPSQQQQLRLPVAWPSVPHARLTSAVDTKALKEDERVTQVIKITCNARFQQLGCTLTKYYYVVILYVHNQDHVCLFKGLRVGENLSGPSLRRWTRQASASTQKWRASARFFGLIRLLCCNFSV